MKKKDHDIEMLLNKYDDILREKVRDSIVHTYIGAKNEMELRQIESRDSSDQRIDHFIRLVFEFSFQKLHKGNRLNAYEILKELETKILNM